MDNMTHKWNQTTCIIYKSALHIKNFPPFIINKKK